MSCNVVLTDKIKLKDQSKNSFSSEEEFDTWLFQNRNEIKEQLGNPKVNNAATLALSADPVELRKSAWTQFMNNMSSLDSVKYKDASRILGKGFEEFITVGTTTLFKQLGRYNDISQPVNSFKEQTATDWIAEKIGEGMTTEEAQRAWKSRQWASELQKIDGNVFGALVEDALTGTNNNIEQLKSHTGFTKQLQTVGLTFDQAVARIKPISENAVAKIKKDIYSKHGSSAKIYTEVPVFSKKMSSEMETAIRTAFTKLGKQVPKAINGYLDVVVQDSNGELHQYDIKLSTHTIQDWWSTTGSNWKYNEVSAQQMAYATMARQWGINFSSINIIPAFIEYNADGSIKSQEIKSESFKTFSLTNDYAIACERYFPIHRKTDSTTINQLSKLMEELYPGQQLDSAIKTIEMNKDYVMNHIVRKKSDGKYHLTLDEENDHSLIGKEVVFDTKEEMEQYVIESYIPKMNEKFSQEQRNNKYCASKSKSSFKNRTFIWNG